MATKINLKIVSQIVDKNKTTGFITEKDMIIPVKKSIPLDLPVVYLLFVPEIDTFIKNKGNSKLGIVNIYGLEIDINNELYQRLRYTTSIIIKKFSIKLISKESSKLVTELKKILESFVLLGSEPMKLFTIPSIKNICSNKSNGNTDPFCKENKLYIPEKYYGVFLKKMAYDILNKNVYGKQILNATIKNEYITKNSFIKRSKEKILLLDSDIKNFLSNK